MKLPVPKFLSPETAHTARAAAAEHAAKAATWASRATGRGAGGMIGGLVAKTIDPTIMTRLVAGRPVVLVTGTNGKSTTTKMLAAACSTVGSVCTNSGGDNMDAGIISALLETPGADTIVLEVDELHIPHVADAVNPTCLVLLNLSRDQLDRCGEIGRIEKALRDTVARHPDMTVVANCDDVAMTSVAFDSDNVVWVSVGKGWLADSASCPRTGGYIVHDESGDWWAKNTLDDGREFRRPTPDWIVTAEGLSAPDATTYPLDLAVPGKANRGNAAQAVAAAVVSCGADTAQAVKATSRVHDVAGRYATIPFEGRMVHMLLAKNPAGWQEALSMVDRSADGLVIAVNGQVADGVDLSWLWDVTFEDFGDTPVIAAGERGTDLAVRLTYATIDHRLIHDCVEAVRACPPGGRVEVLANYTAFRDLRKNLTRPTPPDTDRATGTPAGDPRSTGGETAVGRLARWARRMAGPDDNPLGETIEATIVNVAEVCGSVGRSIIGAPAKTTAPPTSGEPGSPSRTGRHWLDDDDAAAAETAAAADDHGTPDTPADDAPRSAADHTAAPASDTPPVGAGAGGR
ncbi:DUF1727 domain-containing protein, partial [Corynebacterium sp. CCM 8862]|nr:DUF1727 domain-containing protein [Corynebacterium mendelii]